METLEQRVLRHEGLRLKPYYDTKGVLTIGCGRNLQDVGISEEEAMMMFHNDLQKASDQVVDAFPWSVNLPPLKQEILIEMVFQMGLAGVKKFKKMLTSLQAMDYNQASYEMLHSAWASQTPSRAAELAELMRS